MDQRIFVLDHVTEDGEHLSTFVTEHNSVTTKTEVQQRLVNGVEAPGDGFSPDEVRVSIVSRELGPGDGMMNLEVRLVGIIRPRPGEADNFRTLLNVAAQHPRAMHEHLCEQFGTNVAHAERSGMN